MMPIFEEISIQRIEEKYEINNNDFLTFSKLFKQFWRKFHELIDDKGGDEDCRLVLDIIGDVYSNERHCKEAKLSHEDRLRRFGGEEYGDVREEKE